VIADSTGEVIYTIRTKGNRYQPPVYALGNYTVKVGLNKPDAHSFTSLIAGNDPKVAKQIKVTL
jgi:hypothetical protein